MHAQKASLSIQATAAITKPNDHLPSTEILSPRPLRDVQCQHHSSTIRTCLTILAVMPGAGHVSANEGILPKILKLSGEYQRDKLSNRDGTTAIRNDRPVSQTPFTGAPKVCLAKD